MVGKPTRAILGTYVAEIHRGGGHVKEAHAGGRYRGDAHERVEWLGKTRAVTPAKEMHPGGP